MFCRIIVVLHPHRVTRFIPTGSLASGSQGHSLHPHRVTRFIPTGSLASSPQGHSLHPHRVTRFIPTGSLASGSQGHVVVGRVERGVFNRVGETQRYKMTVIITHVGDLELTSKLKGSPESASCIFFPTSYPIFCVHTLTWSRAQCFGNFGPTSFGR